MLNITRRGLFKASAGAAAALAAPAIISRNALSSSGSVNVFAWGDYFDKNSLLADFEKATGIKANLSTYGANEEAENKLRAAGGKGFDLIFPSIDTGPNYYKDNLLQPLDESKLKVDQIIPAIYRNSITLGATHEGKRYLAPFDWGTEALTWDSSVIKKETTEISWADMWGEGLDGKVALRPKSVLASLAIYLDATGQVKTNRGLDAYASEDECRRVFDACLAFFNDNRKKMGAIWTNANEATSAFADKGCVIGQTWDTTGILLNRKDTKWKYAMPKEGGLAWTDTVGIPSGSENLEQAYALINYLYTAEAGAKFANASGYNSCAVGADQLLTDEAKAAFAMAYPGNAIDNLWWWPMMPAFFSGIRGEYVEKLTNAS